MSRFKLCSKFRAFQIQMTPFCETMNEFCIIVSGNPPTLLAVERVGNPNLSCHLSSTPAAQQETSKAAMQNSASPIKQLSSQQQGWWGGGVVRKEGRGPPSQAGAKPAAKLDIKKSSRARAILSIFLPYPPFAGKHKNHSFLHRDTDMARYHDNLLFTIQKLCFHGAKAT